MAKCPKCDKTLTNVNIENITAKATALNWRGICYTCPSCHVILSVSIDPIGIKTEIVQEILTALGKKV